MIIVLSCVLPYSLFGVMGLCVCFCAYCTCVSECVSVNVCTVCVCLDKGVHVFCQWLWHSSSSSSHLFYYPKPLNKHIIVPLLLSVLYSVWERSCQTDDTQRETASLQRSLIFTDILRSALETFSHIYLPGHNAVCPILHITYCAVKFSTPVLAKSICVQLSICYFTICCQ